MLYHWKAGNFIVQKRLYYDLHIHTALSSCADNDMTPNNIVNMAVLKGLDFIAITDHNSAANVKAVIDCAKGKDIIVVPGMEIETAEEVHLICLFTDIDTALEYDRKVYCSLPPIMNNESIFGEQLVIDNKDRVIKKVNRLLSVATRLTVEKVCEEVQGYGGVVIPSHIEREAYSIISNLGAIPDDLGISAVELTPNHDRNFLDRHPILQNYNIVISSDAHYLGGILERTSFFESETKSIDSLFSFLRNKRIQK